MRKLFAAMFAAVVIAALFVAVARSISSSPDETGAPYALEAEAATPGLSEVERLACARCSHADLCTHDARFVETEVVSEHSIRVASEDSGAFLANDCINGNCNHRHEAAIVSTDGYPLKLPLVAVVDIEGTEPMECNANTANRPRVEVLGVGVCSRPDRRSTSMIAGLRFLT